mmetsp:Transcript_15389/g.17307  ORF Transcript_15389/g.17307 Transcript_15389/m.17307 type:complete len:80 (-) Transcript_15389:587-826(-)
MMTKLKWPKDMASLAVTMATSRISMIVLPPVFTKKLKMDEKRVNDECTMQLLFPFSLLLHQYFPPVQSCWIERFDTYMV